MADVIERRVRERIAVLEIQLKRLVSDAVSEKGTRARVNAEITRRFDKIESMVQSINDQMNRGKGFAIGMLFAAGGVGAALTTAISKIFGK